MKKRYHSWSGIFVLFLFLSVIFFFFILSDLSFAQEVGKEGGGPDGVGVLEKIKDVDGDGIPDALDQEKIENVTNNSLAKFQYLQKEWKELLLKWKVGRGVDAFLRKIDPAFLVLFGISYDLNFAFFLLAVLWIIAFLGLGRFLNKGVGWRGYWAYLAGLGGGVVLAQLGVLRVAVTGLVYLLYSSDSLIRRIVSFGVIVFAVVLWYAFWRVLAGEMGKLRKKRLGKLAEEKEEEIIEVAENIEEGAEG